MIKKRASLVVVLLSLIVFATSVVPASAASKKYYLPVTATTYVMPDYSDKNCSGEWVLYEKESYRYDSKGHVTSYKITGYTVEGANKGKKDYSFSESSKWTYKKGKISKCVTSTSGTKTKEVRIYDKHGHLIKYKDKYNPKMTSARISYNKKGWIRRSNDNFNDMKFTYHRNGMPKTINLTHLKSPDMEDLSNEKYNMTFNKKGLITSTRYQAYGGYGGGFDSYTKYTYEYDKKGRVSVVYAADKKDGKYRTFRKTVYTYGKSKTSDKRAYFGTMNRPTHATWVCSDVLSPGMSTVSGE